MLSEMLLPSLGFTPLVMIACAVAMVVLRAGASRVFFDVVGTYQASKMIKDAESAATVLEALHLDAITGIHEAATELSDMFGELADSVIPISREIEEARIQFDKFLTVAEQTKETFDEIAEVGLAFGFAADEAFDAAARMAQLSGVLGGGTTAVGTEIGMVFGLISGMETEEGMQRLINLQQQTKFMTEGIEENSTAEERRQIIYKNSMRVLDELNTIENRSAATMQQITYVMNQFASQAELTGESIAAMAAMSATLIEAGEEQGKGGRALRMIYARLGANTNGAADAVQALGIRLHDAEGNMRPFSQILQEIALKYQDMNGAEQQALAQGIAGNRHYTRLIKLLENVDRVKELELEAHEAMFPAMDEANRRRETELFLLEQTEARLKNYQSALGDTLLPTLTEVTKKQILLTDTLLQVAEAPAIGQLVQTIAALSLSFRSFLGPMFNTIISLQNMRIAIETQRAIQRSLNEVVLAGEHAYKNKMNVIVKNTMQLKLYNSILRDIRKEEDLARVGAGFDVRLLNLKNFLPFQKKAISAAIQKKIASEQLTNALEKELNALDKKRVKTDEEAARMTEIREDIRLEEQARASLNREIEKRSSIVAIGQMRAHEKDAAAQHEKMQALQQQSQMYNRLSYALSGAGMALMMFGHNEKAQRMGILMNTAAMAVQIHKMTLGSKAKIKDMIVTVKKTYAEQVELIIQKQKIKATVAETASTQAATVAVSQKAAATGAQAAAATAATGATVGFGVAVRATAATIQASLGPVGWITLALGALAMAFTNTKKEVDDFSVSMVDFARANELAATMTTEQINAALADQKQILKDTKDATSDVSKAQHDAAVQEIADLNAAKTKRIAQREDLQEIFEMHERQEKATAEARRNAVQEQNKVAGAAFAYQKNLLEDIQKEYGDVLEFFKQNSINTIDELNRFVGRTNDATVEATEAAIGGMSEVVNAGADAIYNFGNAREELFYGFRASNVTGDLIRQVNQQGVETLITTTEVIMTNNFNGMTVPEVADQIIDEIESRGNLSGFNFATAG